MFFVFKSELNQVRRLDTLSVNQTGDGVEQNSNILSPQHRLNIAVASIYEARLFNRIRHRQSFLSRLPMLHRFYRSGKLGQDWLTLRSLRRLGALRRA